MSQATGRVGAASELRSRRSGQCDPSGSFRLTGRNFLGPNFLGTRLVRRVALNEFPAPTDVANRGIQFKIRNLGWPGSGSQRKSTEGSGNCKRFALPASAQPSLREGSGTPKSSVGKVRILLKACDRTSSPVLVRCSEAVLLGRFEIQNQDYLSCSVPLEKKGPLSGDEHF